MVGADDFLPFFIYLVLTADLRHIQSNIRFVERYIDSDEMKGEAYYYFIQLNSAVSYLSTMTNEKAQATITERRDQKREKELRMRQRMSISPTSGTNALGGAGNGIDLAYFVHHEVTSQLRSQGPVDPKRLGEVHEKLAHYAQSNAVRYSGSGIKGKVMCKGAEFPQGVCAVGALCVSSDEVWVAFDNGKVAVVRGDGKLVKAITLPRPKRGYNVPMTYAQGLNAVLMHTGMGRVVKVVREGFKIEDIVEKSEDGKPPLIHDPEFNDVSSIVYDEDSGNIWSAGCAVTPNNSSNTNNREINNNTTINKSSSSSVSVSSVSSSVSPDEIKVRRETQLVVVDSKTKTIISSKVYPGRVAQMVVVAQKGSSQVWAAFDDGLLVCFDSSTGDVISAIAKYQKPNGAPVAVSLATNDSVLWITCDSNFLALSTANFAKTKALTLINSGKSLRPQGSHTHICTVIVKSTTPNTTLVLTETQGKPLCVWSAVKSTPNLICEALVPVLLNRSSEDVPCVVAGSHDGIWAMACENRVFIYSYVV